MKGLPFIAEMAFSACNDLKTNTRRVIHPQPTKIGDMWNVPIGVDASYGFSSVMASDIVARLCEYQAGERRCLLTTWATNPTFDTLKPTELVQYSFNRATRDDFKFWHAGLGPKPAGYGKSRPGRFLPNELRHFMPVFEIGPVRGELLLDITEADAKAEGIRLNRFEVWHWRDDSAIGGIDSLDAFHLLWDSINEDRGYGWESNPWVWRVAFKRIP